MKYVIFGESHGPAIGVTLTGVPAGLELDMDAIAREMARRAPGRSALSTRPQRGRSAGNPLRGIRGKNHRRTPVRRYRQHRHPISGLYPHQRPGPAGHADYPARVRYQGYNDYRGGGHFSGRLTAPLVFAGAVAKQILARRGVFVGAHISSVYGISDQLLEDWDSLRAVADKDFPVLDDQAGEQMRQAILEAKDEQDSVGGAIECAVFGLPAGLGGPDFGENAEGIFSQYLFAVPAVKAVGFGAGAPLP